MPRRAGRTLHYLTAWVRKAKYWSEGTRGEWAPKACVLTVS